MNQKVEKVSSIYSGENICKKVTIDEFISANVKSIYQLNIENNNLENWKKDVLSNFFWSPCSRLYIRLLSVVALLQGCLPATMLSNAWLTMKSSKIIYRRENWTEWMVFNVFGVIASIPSS